MRRGWLRAPRKADDFVQARLQQRFVGACGQGGGCRLFERVKAGEGAAALVECANGVHAACEANVQMQCTGSARCGCMRAKGCQRIVMAGIHGQHVGAVVKRHREGALQVGMQRGDLGGQPCLRLPLCPQQLGAKFAELGRLALAPDDELSAQLFFPPLERAPHMAV